MAREDTKTQPENSEVERPAIATYEDVVSFLKDMLDFRRRQEPGFSVYKATKDLRRTSPTLVSLILQKKRVITLDRVDDLAKLMNLTATEKYYFKSWIQRKDKTELVLKKEGAGRKNVSTGILKDWINVYVKDFFQIAEVRKRPEILFDMLAHLASPTRVQKALDFLLHEGHLRKNLEGGIEIETELAVADPGVPSKKIRQFHKAALSLARESIDIFSPKDRLANTLIIPLNEKSRMELQELINEFAEKLKDFAANNPEGDRLYQLILNLSPVGVQVQ